MARWRWQWQQRQRGWQRCVAGSALWWRQRQWFGAGLRQRWRDRLRGGGRRHRLGWSLGGAGRGRGLGDQGKADNDRQAAVERPVGGSLWRCHRHLAASLAGVATGESGGLGEPGEPAAVARTCRDGRGSPRKRSSADSAGRVEKSGREIAESGGGKRSCNGAIRSAAVGPSGSVVGLSLPLEASGGETLEAAKGSRSEPEPPVAGGGAVTYHEEGVTPRRPDGVGASLWNES